ncbi:tetratricopeptide repeat protein [Symbioplanes lichenis]|uniref:tetratricopeptide repeat protein n=1 Tax=Symbioplanes lichenis TaxID=1629072 RepID=UPI0027382F1F|nr:tetratricopeptide repeat protein [Actinoplanes lichenis]
METGADDLARVRTHDHLAEALQALSQRCGLTLTTIVDSARGLSGRVGFEALDRRTVDDVFRGAVPITKPLLVSILMVCDQPPEVRQRWLAVWERLEREEKRSRSRVDETAPRGFGIHSAITAPDAVDFLPRYVSRDFDFRLRAELAADPDRGAFVVLVGGSSTGKTRSLYEAVQDGFPDWSLVQPVEAAELLELRSAPPRRTVFWLDELQRYLGGRPALTFECVRALMRRGNIVVGTLWPGQYASWRSASEDMRRLFSNAAVISVPDELSMAELHEANEIAEEDSRIRQALDTQDAGLTQALAGGPELVMCWEQPVTPYAKAVIAAAADAHRLGVQAPLTAEFLREAMAGYLPPPHQVRPKEEWLGQALPHATRQLYGDVSALVPNGANGTVAGYTMADYLAQHLRRVRRTTVVPEPAWDALVTGLRDAADLRRLADAALARLRLRYAEPALQRLVDESADSRAAIELAELLIRQDRFDRAVDVLRRSLEADPRDRELGLRLARAQELWQRVEKLRPAADAGDPAAAHRLTEILADCGITDDLRLREEQGDRNAAEQLVDLLADHGFLPELHQRADRGQVFAAHALAELYAAWGETAWLQHRARRGDRTARLRLARMESGRPAETDLAELRVAVAEGKPGAALQLSARLFELRDERGLLDELDAGTEGAADRLLALYTATGRLSPEQRRRLRVFGLNADGSELLGP